MSKIAIIVPTGETVEADIVRYFKAYGKRYLIYTLNEKDEQGFVKLYVAKIDGQPKALVGEFIEDDNEWSVLKGEFKKIIGENGDSGRTSADDQNPAELTNVNIRGHRIIKLMESYVNLLGANQKEFQPEVAMPDFQTVDAVEAPVQPQQPTYQVPPTPFMMPQQPTYQAPREPERPIYPTYEAPKYQAPQPAYQAPQAYPTAAVPPVQEVTTAPGTNYEELYKDVKAKLDRCTAELEKVTNENIELRIKIDDIREILNEN